MRKGYITVFFSIAVLLTFSFLVGCVYGVRESAIRLKVRQAANISLRSTFCEYERELMERYNLIFTDASFGYEVDSMILPKEHLLNCLNENFEEEKLSFLGGRDFCKLRATDVETLGVRFSTDDCGRAIRNQAVRVMKTKTGLECFEDYLSMEELLDEEVFKINREDLSKAVASAEKSEDYLVRKWSEASKELILEEKEVSKLSTLRSVLSDTASISTIEVPLESFLHNREINKGNLVTGKAGDPEEKALFCEYLLSYLSNYEKPLDNTVFTYELEYLIGGHEGDAKNLEAAVNRLLLSREAFNISAICQDEEKIGKIKEVSETLSALLLEPELEPSFEALIVALIGFEESKADVRALLHGKRVPLIKEPSEFSVTLDNLFSKNAETECDRGLTYTEYLRLFLYSMNTDTLTIRLMDLMELNVRYFEDKNFKLDFCFDAWEVNVYVQSEYGYHYLVSRKYDCESL